MHKFGLFHRLLLWLIMLGIALTPAVIQADAPAQVPQKTASLLHVKEAIGPAMADDTHRGIETAKKAGSAATIPLDTSGALDKSMPPINYAGLALILFGIAFLIAEVFFASGVLAIGGIVAFVFGSVLLLDSGVAGFSIAWPLIVGITVVIAGFFWVVVNLAVQARFRPIITGREELPGSVGEIEVIENGHAFMRVEGELWQVRSETSLALKQKVVVTGREGLLLLVTAQK